MKVYELTDVEVDILNDIIDEYIYRGLDEDSELVSKTLRSLQEKFEN